MSALLPLYTPDAGERRQRQQIADAIPRPTLLDPTLRTQGFTASPGSAYRIAGVGGAVPKVLLPPPTPADFNKRVTLYVEGGTVEVWAVGETSAVASLGVGFYEFACSGDGSRGAGAVASYPLTDGDKGDVVVASGGTVWDVKTATTTRRGKCEIATAAEVAAGAEGSPYVIPPIFAQYHPSAAKAWGKFNGGTGTTFETYNVASLTRAAAGQYDVVFTNAMSGTGYVVIATLTTGGSARLVAAVNASIATTGFRLETRDTAGVLQDAERCFFSVLGALP